MKKVADCSRCSACPSAHVRNARVAWGYVRAVRLVSLVLRGCLSGGVRRGQHRQRQTLPREREKGTGNRFGWVPAEARPLALEGATMAKTSMIVKSKRKPKYAVQQ